MKTSTYDLENVGGGSRILNDDLKQNKNLNVRNKFDRIFQTTIGSRLSFQTGSRQLFQILNFSFYYKTCLRGRGRKTVEFDIFIP